MENTSDPCVKQISTALLPELACFELFSDPSLIFKNLETKACSTYSVSKRMKKAVISIDVQQCCF